MSHGKLTYPKSSLHFLKIQVDILALELPNRQSICIYPIPDIITSQILFIEQHQSCYDQLDIRKRSSSIHELKSLIFI